MRVLRDDLLKLRVPPAQPVDFPPRLTQRGLEPRDLTLETADVIVERVDGALLLVRVGLPVDGPRAERLLEEALERTALLVALLHSADAVHDEPGVIGVLANGIALNVPMNYFLGRAALRTRSLYLPTAVHLALDTTRNVWM